MKFIFLPLLLIVSLGSFAQMPLSDPNGNWTLLTDYSDEFETPLDVAKWDININDWGAWSWEPENVWLADGKMHLRMVNEKHVRSGDTLYFKSGAARQKKTITYGYFEAKVKGCATFPGVCPAFWMYSQSQTKNGVDYNEIDFMEIQQRQFNLNGIDCNTHYSLTTSAAWVDTKNYYIAPFKPNEGFHVYGCNVTPTNITFFIDGVQVASNVNQYFILPMKLIFSMGVRPPLMEYGPNGEKLPLPFINKAGFPTEMQVEYLRVWNTTPTKINDVVAGAISGVTNFPNPFTRHTTISYRLAKNGFVNLSVFDVTGRKIKDLANGIMAAGKYNVPIASDKIGGTGVYMCKLAVEGQIYTHKMVVVK